MTIPVIPLDITTTQTISYTPVNKKYQYKKGETVWYHNPSLRKFPTQQYQISQFHSDFATLESFLLSLNGIKPFQWSYNNENYICNSYTLEYDDGNSGTITMTWTQYTGNAT